MHCSIGRTYAEVAHTFAVIRKQARTVWERTKEALRDKKLPPTQAEAARLAEVKQPSVAEWNRPGIVPAMETAVRLSMRLGVCVEWLLTERGPKYPTDVLGHYDEIAAELLQLWDRLSDDAKYKILAFAEIAVSAPPDQQGQAIAGS